MWEGGERKRRGKAREKEKEERTGTSVEGGEDRDECRGRRGRGGHQFVEHVVRTAPHSVCALLL